MTQLVQAIYEHGVFRPLEPVMLAEHEQVSLIVTEPAGAAENGIAPIDAATLNLQHEALAALRAQMDALPACAPLDGLSGADHDEILFGSK